MVDSLATETVWVRCGKCKLDITLVLKPQVADTLFRHVKNGQVFCLGCGEKAGIGRTGGNA